MWWGEEQPPWQSDSVCLVVLVGGGHSHMQILRALHGALIPPQNIVGTVVPRNIQLTLISDQPNALYSGMVPGVITGSYASEDVAVDLPALCAHFGWRFVQGKMTSVDFVSRVVTLENAAPIPFHLCSIDVGSASFDSDMPGVRELTIPTRPLFQFIDRVDEAVRRFQQSQARQAALLQAPRGSGFGSGIGAAELGLGLPALAAGGSSAIAGMRPSLGMAAPPALGGSGERLEVVVVGGGVAGVELAFTIDARIRRFTPFVQVTLVASTGVLSGSNPALVSLMETTLADRGIRVISGKRVVRLDKGRIVNNTSSTSSGGARTMQIEHQPRLVLKAFAMAPPLSGLSSPSSNQSAASLSASFNNPPPAAAGGGNAGADDTSIEELRFDLCLWSTGAAPPAVFGNGHWHSISDVPFSPTPVLCTRGYLLVNEALQTVSAPNVFGAGDCITIRGFEQGYPPKAGVFAVRQGPILVANLITMLKNPNATVAQPSKSGFLTSSASGSSSVSSASSSSSSQSASSQSSLSLERYIPQLDYLRLINLGDGRAVGAKWSFVFRGAWVYALKDWIDRKWMALFQFSKRPVVNLEALALLEEFQDNYRLPPAPVPSSSSSSSSSSTSISFAQPSSSSFSASSSYLNPTSAALPSSFSSSSSSAARRSSGPISVRFLPLVNPRDLTAVELADVSTVVESFFNEASSDFSVPWAALQLMAQDEAYRQRVEDAFQLRSLFIAS